MAKYSKEIVAKILALIESDSYTIAEICDNVGIHKSTFHEWENKKSDFSDSIKRAKLVYDENLIVQAKRSLMKKIKGYTEEEIKTVYAPAKDGAVPKIKEQTRIKKHFQPDTACIIFTLTNKVPDEYKHRQTVDSKVSLINKIDELNEDQLNAVIDQVLAVKNQ